MNDNFRSFAFITLADGDITPETVAQTAAFTSGSRYLGSDFYFNIVAEGVFTDQSKTQAALGQPPTICALNWALYMGDEDELFNEVVGTNPDFSGGASWPLRYATQDAFTWALNEKRMLYRQEPWNSQTEPVVLNPPNASQFFIAWSACFTRRVRRRRIMGNQSALIMVFDTENWINDSTFGIDTPRNKSMFIDVVHWVWTP